MAYIEPKGKVWLCKNVPLNPSYEDTMTWNSIEEQINYFIGKTKWSSEKYTPIKERQGVLRFNGAVNKFYDCNYMMFENDNFYNTEYNWGEEKYNRLAPKKYFFAFITNVEYINPETTLIHFQLDVMQTWFFEIEWERSLIEREHVKDDSLYANLEPENIQVNERIPYSNDFRMSSYLGERVLIAGFTENPNEIEADGGGSILGNIEVKYSPYESYPNLTKSTQPNVVDAFNVSNIALTSGASLSVGTYTYGVNSFFIDASVTEFKFSVNVSRFNQILGGETIYNRFFYVTAKLTEGNWVFSGYETTKENIPTEDETLVEVKYNWTLNPPIKGVTLYNNFNITDLNSQIKWKTEYVISGVSNEVYFYVPSVTTNFTFKLILSPLYPSPTNILMKDEEYNIKAEKIDDNWVFSEFNSVEGE